MPKDSYDWRSKIGDCIYKYPLNGNDPIQRKGLHCQHDINTDLSGENVLISDYFFYFGGAAIKIPKELYALVKKEQGHLIEKGSLINDFEIWLTGFGYASNIIVGNPQMQSLIQKQFNSSCSSKCRQKHSNKNFAKQPHRFFE